MGSGPDSLEAISSELQSGDSRRQSCWYESVPGQFLENCGCGGRVPLWLTSRRYPLVPHTFTAYDLKDGNAEDLKVECERPTPQVFIVK